ncbi:MAG TPA: VOC family protein [Symbiobacteriaceae bacterium]|nr:VOC family protein [Symbiobacteriaceae bacterium]
MSHPVVHFEILGKDGKQLQEYYANLFGWKINADNPMAYGLVEAGQGGIGGGISGMEGPVQQGVMIYVAVPDLQAALDKAVALGGKVVHPIEHIPGMVTFAQIQDPQGNIIGMVKDSME